MKLIDGDALVERIKHECNTLCTYEQGSDACTDCDRSIFIKQINDMPELQAEPSKPYVVETDKYCAQLVRLTDSQARAIKWVIDTFNIENLIFKSVGEIKDLTKR